MNRKIKNIKAVNHPLHLSFLTYFPILLIITTLLFSASIWKAKNDQRNIAQNLLERMNSMQVREGVLIYRVLKDDTLDSVAEKFNINTQTILWANEIPLNKLTSDMVIVIPPVDGVIHKVAKGDTTQSIADLYKTDPENIRSFPYNFFQDEEGNQPVIEQFLIVPDGIKETSTDVLGEFLKRIRGGD